MSRVPKPRAQKVLTLLVWLRAVATFAAEPAAIDPRGDLTLADARAAALAGSPELRTVAADVRAREARVRQSALPPNPELSATVEDVGRLGGRSTFASPYQTTLLLSRPFSLGDERTKRVDAARSERALAARDEELARRSVTIEATRRFIAVRAGEERLSVATDLVRTAEEAHRAVVSAVRAGALGPVDEIRARVAASRARLDRGQIEQELAAARILLSESWGSAEAHFARTVGSLERIYEAPPGATLASAVATSLEVVRAGDEVNVKDSALALERARAVPTAALGLGVRRFDDDRGSLVLEASLPLPLFDRNQGAIAEAVERAEGARAARTAAELRARTAVEVAMRGLVQSRERVVALRDEIVPDARAAYEGSLRSFREGLFRSLDVLDAQRALFEARSQYVDALATHHLAALELERASGISILEGGLP